VSGDYKRRLSARDYLLMGALGLLTFLSRVPFRSQVLYHWDSVNFANGMRQFDMLQEHPQPPGYILYVWLCRLVDLLFHDANGTMVWISVVAGGLAVVALYLLGREMWGWRVGLVAGLLLASSPLFWFYGEIALPHTLDTFLVLLSLWLLYRVRRGEDRFLWPAVVTLGIAGGVRPQTLVFLLPLAMYATWRVGWRRLLLAGLLGAAVCLLWSVPLMVSCGGIGNYLEKMGTYSARFQRTTSILEGAGWPGVAHNLRKLAIYTAYGAGAALVPLGLYGLARLARRRWPGRRDHLAFLGLWTLPALLFYSLIHMGQQGLVFVFLPALLLLAAVATVRLAGAWRRGWVAVALLLALLNSGTFCLVPEYPLGPGTQRLLTRDTLVNSDHYYQDRFAVIRERFSPQNTAILAANSDHVAYYLPEYVVLPFTPARPGVGEVLVDSAPSDGGEAGSSSDQDGVVVVVFDAELTVLNETPSAVERIPLEHGGVLEYFALTEGTAFHWDRYSFGVTH